MYATDFEYADKRLSDFGCVTCYLDSKPGVSEVDIGCENVYTTTFQIMKNPSGKEANELYMTYEEVRELSKWLNRREDRKFKVSDIHYYGSFNIKEKTINDRIVALVLTFTGNAPYGFGDVIKNEFDFTESTSFCIYGDSDELGSIYPTVTIIPKEDCIDSAFELKNVTTGSKVTLLNLKKDEIVKLDGEHKMITSSDKKHTATTLFNDFNYEWLDLLITDDSQDNIFAVNMPCYISIEYKPIRKVGVC